MRLITSTGDEFKLEMCQTTPTLGDLSRQVSGYSFRSRPPIPTSLGLGVTVNPPNIIFWNVRAATLSYPAAADQKGVMLLSGYSPALMKHLVGRA